MAGDHLAMPVFLLFSLRWLWSMDWCSEIYVDGVGDGRVRLFYHYAKRALPLVVITWVVYLAPPFSLHLHSSSCPLRRCLYAECGGDGEYF